MAEFEILKLKTYHNRSEHVIDKFCQATGIAPVDRYRGDGDCLVLWGVGGVDQLQAYRRHRQSGRNVLMFDIGYFGRDNGARRSCFRMSVSDWHPHNLLQYAPSDDGRFAQLGIQLEDLHDEQGHILICGIGPKSRRLYGYSGMEWEQGAYSRAVESFPGARVVYRPKPKTGETLAGCEDGSVGDIRHWLEHCRLVIVHHSNVSADAAVFGVPCVASDGAGAFLYPSQVSSCVSHVSVQDRRYFLHRLAWFNWHPDEMRQMLAFYEIIRERLKQ